MGFYKSKSFLVMILSLFLICTTFFINVQLNANKLITPKETNALGVSTPNPTTVSFDICENYKNVEPTPKTTQIPIEEQNIQKNIGYQNNKFGLYIYQIDDFARRASEMINSNGGDWGYVLVPYNVKDYDSKKWNSFFEVLNQKHLIPIIQLWDLSEDPKDAIRDTKKSAKFLNSLNWPIKKRYVSVYNEVNDERFWRGGLDPKEYARVLNYTIDIYKYENKDFFMLNGAFNASARNGSGYISEDEYLRQMNEEVGGIFKKLDGWASHPYPHINGYLGLPTDTGRDSVRAYEWELNILDNEYGVKNLPVFITEAGWPHAEGENYNSSYVNEDTAAEYLKYAFEKVWLPDDRVVAITPFTIRYDEPFDHFSFIKKDGSTYKVFDVLKDMPKQAGIPPVIETHDPLYKYCNQK